MQDLIKYIEQEVERRNAKGYEMTPWSLTPRDAAGALAATNVKETSLAAGTLIVVTKAFYQLSHPLPLVLPALENNLILNGSPGVDIGRLIPVNITADLVNSYISLEWNGVSPFILGSIKPNFVHLANTLRFAKLEGWDIQLKK